MSHYKTLLRKLELAIFFFTLNRIVFLLLFVSRAEFSGPMQLINLFYTGFRFDVMVYGYFFIFYYLFRIIKVKFFSLLSEHLFLFSFYATSIFDLLWMGLTQDRINSNFSFSTLNQKIHFDHKFYVIVVLQILFYLLHMRLLKIQKNYPLDFDKLHSPTVFLILVLFIRSSLGPYHLDLRHSNISNTKNINLSTLNSLYVLDQALRNRR